MGGNAGSIESPVENILTPLFVNIPIRFFLLFLSLPFCLTAKILSSGVPLIGGWLPRDKIEWEPSFVQKGCVPCFLPKVNQVRFFGPQNMTTHVYIPGVGRWIVFLVMIPIGPFCTESVIY